MHQIFMQRAIELARRAGSATKSNPQVGAVLVYEDKIIGEGYHKAYGEAHAEVNAVQSVSNQNRHLIKDSTIYVSLEPCCFFGKTPACTDLILKEQIKKVVISYVDKTPEVSGHGIEILRSNGVEVIEHVLSDAGELLAQPRNTLADKGRPYVILKFAESKDGYFSLPNQQVWLTNHYSKILVHKWRGESDAILVGTNTIRVDDPTLTNRLYFGTNPDRIVLDKNLKLDKHLNVFNTDAKTIVLNDTLTEGNYFKCSMDWNSILKQLGELKIKTLFVEGGAQVLNTIFESGLWDECRLLISSKTLGSGLKINKPDNWNIQQTLHLGSDQIIQAFPMS